jgi:protease IV
MSWGKRRAIVIGVLILFFVAVFWAARKPARLASKSVLVIDAQGEIDEQQPFDLVGSLTGQTTPVLDDYLRAIDSARTDPRITGIVVRIAPLDTGWAKLEEIRAHLADFQKSGKPSICYLGYDGIANREYYLASACQQIWLMPTAPVDITGMMAEAIFYRGTLDKLKIVPEFYHTGQYKTYGNTFTEKKFTPAHREEVESLLHSIYDQYIGDAAESRHMDRAQFEALVDRGPLLPSDAVQSGIADRLGYWDQVQDYFKDRDRVWNPVSLSRYVTSMNDDGFGGEKIAVVHATGLIVSGTSENSPQGGFVMGGDSVASDIRTARQDPDIKAIILRVDSGGGSVVGSEAIRREVMLAKGTKPVVVSMSDVAASGGYWISAQANKIVAEPNTITGSIGVVIGKMNLSGLYNLLGVSTDSVTTSDNATLFSDQQNFTPEQRAFIQNSIQEMYGEFTRNVAEGRGMTPAAVDAIGQGRVWTGAQAKKLGLVDELGGLDRAIEVAKQLAAIPAAQHVRIVRFPEEKNLLEQLFERDTDGTDESHSLAGIVRRLTGVMEPVEARIPFELHIH